LLSGVPSFVPSPSCGDITIQYNLKSNDRTKSDHFWHQLWHRCHVYKSVTTSWQQLWCVTW
jgi:hypothetical protein